MINVSDALSLDIARPKTVRRASEGSVQGNRFIPGGTADFKAMMSVQAPSPTQMEMLEDGERIEDARLMISNKRLYPIRGKTEADMIRHDGAWHKVTAVMDMSEYGVTTALTIRQTEEI